MLHLSDPSSPTRWSQGRTCCPLTRSWRRCGAATGRQTTMTKPALLDRRKMQVHVRVCVLCVRVCILLHPPTGLGTPSPLACTCACPPAMPSSLCLGLPSRPCAHHLSPPLSMHVYLCIYMYVHVHTHPSGPRRDARCRVAHPTGHGHVRWPHDAAPHLPPNLYHHEGACASVYMIYVVCMWVCTDDFMHASCTYECTYGRTWPTLRVRQLPPPKLYHMKVQACVRLLACLCLCQIAIICTAVPHQTQGKRCLATLVLGTPIHVLILTLTTSDYF
jgi:hypothetical protein